MDRLAHPRIEERILFPRSHARRPGLPPVVHRQVHCTRAGDGGDVRPAAVLHPREIFRIDLLGDLDLPRQQGSEPGRAVRNALQPYEFEGDGVAPVTLPRLQIEMVLREPGHEAIGAGADRMGGEGGPPFFLDQRFRHHRNAGEVDREQRVRPAERHLERGRVHHLVAGNVVHELPHLRFRVVRRIHDRLADVVGGHRHAVLERHPGAQRELPGQRREVLPRRRDARDRLALRAEDRNRVEDIALPGFRGRFAAHDRVERGGPALEGNDQRVLRAVAGRRLGGGRLGEQASCDSAGAQQPGDPGWHRSYPPVGVETARVPALRIASCAAFSHVTSAPQSRQRARCRRGCRR